MSRIRDESAWNFTHHVSIEAFLSAERNYGAHAISYRGETLDVLIVNRNAKSTLIVFHAAVPTKISTYPVFSGVALADATNTNLISISDPSIAIPGVLLGWHLGNKNTGPLKQPFTALIRHILMSLQSEKSIFFGASGGGYVAAHIAPEFPGCIALSINPRISLRDISQYQLQSFFEKCHGQSRVTSFTSEQENLLKLYGPLSIAETISADMSHYLAIYQNVGDMHFLTTQTLPLIEGITRSSKVRLRLSIDGYGHLPIPKKHLHDSLNNLINSSDTENALNKSNFLPPEDAMRAALRQYPETIKNLSSHEKKIQEITASNTSVLTKLKTKNKVLSDTQDKLTLSKQRLQEANVLLESYNTKIARAENDLRLMKQEIETAEKKLVISSEVITDLSDKIYKLENPPSFLHKILKSHRIQSVSQYVPAPIRRRISKCLNRHRR